MWLYGLLFYLLFCVSSLYGDLNEMFKDNPSRRTLTENYTQDIWRRLQLISNDEVGVTHLQEIYDRMLYSDNKDLQGEGLVYSLATNLMDSLNRYLRILLNNKRQVETSYLTYSQRKPNPYSDLKDKFSTLVFLNQSAYYECCNVSPYLSANAKYKCAVSFSRVCDLYPSVLPFGFDQPIFNPGMNLTETFSGYPGAKPLWQYFISRENLHNIYPASDFCNDRKFDCPISKMRDAFHRSVYVATVSPSPKLVVVVLDHGVGLKLAQFRRSKLVAHFLINSLSHDDRATVVAISDNVTVMEPCVGCDTTPLIPMTRDGKNILFGFLDRRLDVKTALTDHKLALLEAFRALKFAVFGRSDIDSAVEFPARYANTRLMILYISRGIMQIQQAPDVVALIKRENTLLGNRVVINSFLILDPGQSVTVAEHFMKFLSDQSLPTKDAEAAASTNITRGIRYTVTNDYEFTERIGDFYRPLGDVNTAGHMYLSLPDHDMTHRRHVLSLAVPCYAENVSAADGGDTSRIIGITGVDIDLEELVQNFTYFSSLRNASVEPMLIHRSGYVLAHPLLPRLLDTSSEHFHLTDISHFETHRTSNFSALRSLILTSTSEGEATARDLSSGLPVKLHWRPVALNGSYPFVVVLRSTLPFSVRLVAPQQVPGSRNYIFHQLVLYQPARHQCWYLHQLATNMTATYYLSPAAFRLPYEHLFDNQSGSQVNVFNIYIGDTSTYITNPGLQPAVREDVRTLWSMAEWWQRRLNASNWRGASILRRYAATTSGVFSVFPGGLLDTTIDPARQAWFLKATRMPAKMIFTRPYFDPLSNGIIVSLSRTIFEGRDTTLHTEHDKVMAVVGTDFTVGYFYRLLIDTVPICQDATVRCFIVDDEGYVIAHPALLDHLYNQTQERFHIVYLEPAIIRDLLNHEHFMRKYSCVRLSDRTVQRFYSLNTSFTQTLASLKSSGAVDFGPCERYEIHHIPNTNAFFGFINRTCDSNRASGVHFCPCSIKDRACLNCQRRMEPKECECPCECSMAADLCSLDMVPSALEYPVCPPQPEMRLGPSVSHRRLLRPYPLPQCHPVDCAASSTRLACLNAVGCEWCHLGVTTTPLSTIEFALDVPFCTMRYLCMGGRMSSDLLAERPVLSERAIASEQSSSTPVGPAAGAVMGCVLVLVVGFYCYRHKMARLRRAYLDGSTPPNGAAAPILHADDDSAPDHIYESVDHLAPAVTTKTNFFLLGFDPSTISPYRINPNYRRPTAGADSDHGYSTMTPQGEDSERASTVLEPLKPRAGGRARAIGDPDSSDISVFDPLSEHESVASSTFSMRPIFTRPAGARFGGPPQKLGHLAAMPPAHANATLLPWRSCLAAPWWAQRALRAAAAGSVVKMYSGAALTVVDSSCDCSDTESITVVHRANCRAVQVGEIVAAPSTGNVLSSPIAEEAAGGALPAALVAPSPLPSALDALRALPDAESPLANHVFADIVVHAVDVV